MHAGSITGAAVAAPVALALLSSAQLSMAQPPALANVDTSDSEFFGPQNLPGQPRPPQAGVAPAPAPTPPREWFGGAPWLEWTRVSGDWAGARTRVEDVGITIGGSYTLDWSSVWSGGVSRRASTRSLLDLNASIDTEKAISLRGGTLFIDF